MKTPYYRPFGINPFVTARQAWWMGLGFSLVAAPVTGAANYLGWTIASVILRGVMSLVNPVSAFAGGVPAWFLWSTTAVVAVIIVPVCHVAYMQDYQKSKASVQLWVARNMNR